jgi:hypothetical protein
MKIKIVQVLADGGRETPQELLFSSDSETNNLAVKKCINLLNTEPIEVSAIHTLISMNLSLFITQGNQHIATAL